MKKTFLPVLSIVVCCIFSACNTEVNKVKEKPMFVSLLGYQFKERDIVYQFHEEYGFPDACRHTRCLIKKSDFVKEDSWKKLPVSARDLKKINQIDGKADKLPKNAFHVVYTKKYVQADISNIMEEFFKPNADSLSFIMNLNKGYYKFDKNNIQIFDEINKKLYIEIHTCSQ